MDTVKRIFKKDFQVCDDFIFKEGSSCTTSKLNEACAAHGPKPEKNCVVVFSQYWVSVPIDYFENG